MPYCGAKPQILMDIFEEISGFWIDWNGDKPRKFPLRYSR
jgi:hypothetical protein